MKVLIQDLEQKFLPTMLTNGLSYWKKDMFDIVEDSSTILKAVVFGTDEYQTEIHLSGNFVTDVNCTCPYNSSLFCKHVAILYYEKLKEALNLKKTAARKPKAVRLTKKVYQTDIFTKIEQTSYEELKKIVVSRLQFDEDFKQSLMQYFESNEEDPLLLYQSTKDKIKEIFKRNKKHRDYIDYSDSNKIGRLICEISDKARAFFDEENYLQAFAVCKAVIETMIKPLMYTDTSSGLFYKGLDECVDVLSMMSSKKLSDNHKKKIVVFLLKEAKNKDNFGFDYEKRFLEIAIKFSSSSEKDLILSTIDLLIKTEGNSEELALISYEVVLKFEGEENANQLLQKRIILPAFRKIVYKKLMNNKQYPEAKELMIEGIKANQEYRGIVYQWKNNLLDIAQQTNNSDDIIKISKLMFQEYGFSKNRDKDYFEILKKEISEKEWEKESIALLSNLTRHSEKEEFYYRENRCDELIESLKMFNQYYSQELNIEAKFLDVLLPDYEIAIKNIILARADQYLVNNTGTTAHKNVCQSLINLKKRGVDIEDMKQYFSEKYFNRPSFKNVLLTFFG